MKKSYNDNKTMKINTADLESLPELNPLDTPESKELIDLMMETMTCTLDSLLPSFTIDHGMSYLDSLVSLPIEKCSDSDKEMLTKVLQMVQKRTTEALEKIS